MRFNLANLLTRPLFLSPDPSINRGRLSCSPLAFLGRSLGSRWCQPPALNFNLIKVTSRKAPVSSRLSWLYVRLLSIGGVADADFLKAVTLASLR